MHVANEKLCDHNLIHAYVDGELDNTAQTHFEHHLDSCANCRKGLLAYQQFICELDAVLADEVEVSVPLDFSRIVAARAVSDMSGVRTFAENRKALAICIILGIAGFALVGATTREMSTVVATRLVGKVFGVLGFAWKALYDSITSFAVVSRVVGRKLIVETGNVALVLVLLVLAVLLLSRLISDYHRTGTIE